MSTHPNRYMGGGDRVRYHTLWCLSLKVYRGTSSRPDALAGKILMAASSVILCGRPFKPSLKALGKMHGRSSRSIARAVDALETAGFISVRRRGKKLSNVYRLASWLWRRLTGRDGAPSLWLPGVNTFADGAAVALARLRSRWEAARREVVPATN